MNLETQLKRLAEMLAPRQQTFDFTCCELWQQLPREDRQACLKVFAKLLGQVLSESLPQEHEDE